MDQQLPYFYTDNYSRYLIVGHLTWRENPDPEVLNSRVHCIVTTISYFYYWTTTRPDKLGRFFLAPCKKWPVYATVQAYTGQCHFLQGTYQKHTAIYYWLPCTSHRCQIQGDQLNIAVYFWYFEKSDLSSQHVYSVVHWTSHFSQGTREHGHV